jgi:hypothetical protein
MAGLFAKLKETIFSLIIWAVVAAGGLLYFNVGHKAPSIPPSPPNIDIDFSGYFATFDQLAGRVNEQDEFVKRMKGKKVRWRGYVSYVRNSDVSPSKIALAIAPTTSDMFQIALVYFGEDMRIRLFALREKDSVEITGTFDSETWRTPYIQGDTMQLLTAVPITPPSPAAALGEFRRERAFWEGSLADDDDVVASCALVTVPAKPLPAEIDATTGQMPAILRREDCDTSLRSSVAEANGLQEPQQSCEALRVHFWRPVEFLSARMPRDHVRT